MTRHTLKETDQTVQRLWSRRRKGSAVAAAALTAVLMMSGCAAAGNGADDPAGGDESLGKLSLQLGWIKDVSGAGPVLSELDGFAEEQGFSSAEVLSGGANSSPPATVVAEGKALLALSSVAAVAAANDAGADLRVVGAVFQVNPFVVISMPDSPIDTPQDLVGKKIGVQETNIAMWEAFLRINDIDPADVESVPAGGDAAPLLAGEVDGWVSYISAEPVALELRGVETHKMLWADYGFGFPGSVYIASQAAIDENPDAVRAALASQVQGWRAGLADPQAAAQTVVEASPDLDLSLEQQIAQLEAQNALMVTDETTKNGLLTISSDLVKSSGVVLKAIGLSVDASKLFNLDLIREVHDADPSLRELP